jgi:anhydro-N-acetylmuramic acid kinase
MRRKVHLRVTGMPQHYIGLMSGTSLDGVDGVLMAFHGNGQTRVLSSCALDLPAELRAELLALNRPGPNELHRAAVAAHQLAELYARGVLLLLKQSGLSENAICAIGAHGQTVRHAPPAPGNATPYTLQLNQPALLAELCGITVVADFRSRDISAGGQGAPLVPAFHKQVFGRTGESVAVVNIGGIANITALPADDRVLGLDTGPGNVLLDLWCHRHTGRNYDANGEWAASGRLHASLLSHLLKEPYFQAKGIKSTGRDLFNPAWLDDHLQGFADIDPADIQATLTELTAQTIVDAIVDAPWDGLEPREVLICGGGARNAYLMSRIAALMPQLSVLTTDSRGWPVSQVEAAAFAWLAKQTREGKPGNEPQVTGAKGPRILGAIYPA